MKRLLAGFIVAGSITAGLVVVAPVKVAAQDSTVNCLVACHDVFVDCITKVRSGAAAAACRTAAVACVKACFAE